MQTLNAFATPATTPARVFRTIAASALLSVVLLFVAAPGHADNKHHDATRSIALFTEAMPSELRVHSCVSGLSVTAIEHLDALGANIVYVRLDENHVPASALAIFKAAFPAAHFELFEDFEVEEARNASAA